MPNSASLPPSDDQFTPPLEGRSQVDPDQKPPSTDQAQEIRRESNIATTRKITKYLTGGLLVAGLTLSLGLPLVIAACTQRRRIASAALLPAQHRPLEELRYKVPKWARKQLNLVPIPKLPDKDNQFKTTIEISKDVKLSAMVQIPKSSELSHAGDLPFVVLFCQNGEAYEDARIQDMAKEYNDAGFNVLMFNYRGVGESTTAKPPTAIELIDDAKEVMRQLQTGGITISRDNEQVTFKVPAEETVADGSSLGGSLAELASHELSPRALNRTFSTFSAAADNLVRETFHYKKIGAVASKIALNIIGKNVKELDVSGSLAKRAHGVTVIESAGNYDTMIAEEARLKRPTEFQWGHCIVTQVFPYASHSSTITLSSRSTLKNWILNDIKEKAERRRETRNEIAKLQQEVDQTLTPTASSASEQESRGVSWIREMIRTHPDDDQSNRSRSEYIKGKIDTLKIEAKNLGMDTDALSILEIRWKDALSALKTIEERAPDLMQAARSQADSIETLTLAVNNLDKILEKRVTLRRKLIAGRGQDTMNKIGALLREADAILEGLANPPAELKEQVAQYRRDHEQLSKIKPAGGN